VRDVEVGAKFNGLIGGAPVQLNVDGYNVWADDIQKVGYAVINDIPQSATVNVPTGTVKGIEGDFQIAPLPHLRLGANVSYTDAEFHNSLAPLFGVFTTFGPYGDSPRFSGSVFAEVNMPLVDNYGTLTYRVDSFAQSSFYFSNTADTFTPGSQVPGYALVNMRLDWANPFGAKGWTVGAFVKNLADRLYYLGGTGSAQATSFEAALPGPPRTYGLVLRYAF
jgi:iron complex outermembrane recepter protein